MFCFALLCCCFYFYSCFCYKSCKGKGWCNVLAPGAAILPQKELEEQAKQLSTYIDKRGRKQGELRIMFILFVHADLNQVVRLLRQIHNAKHMY